MTTIFTQAVHAGERERQPGAMPVTTPIYHSVGYLQDSAQHMEDIFGGEKPGYVYRRYESPTVAAFEEAMTVLENGEAAFATSSGMAAVHGALLAAGVRAGTSVVAARDCYGATYSLLSTLLSEQGVSAHFVDVTDLDEVRQTCQQVKPVALLVETISNPLLKVADIPSLAAIARPLNSVLIVDSTFATPYLCRPLQLGADYVVHSASKYIGGHGDVLAGVVVTTANNRQQLFALEKQLGAVLAPEVAWLALRGLKTLPLRMRQHCLNAAAIAEWLTTHPAVASVHYPGLPWHPQHELARKQFELQGFGGMISLELARGNQAAAFRFLNTLSLVLPATTLGDVYSLALYPRMASHRAVPAPELERLGIGEGLLRLSVGIEDIVDLQADLDNALAAAHQG